MYVVHQLRILIVFMSQYSDLWIVTGPAASAVFFTPLLSVPHQAASLAAMRQSLQKTRHVRWLPRNCRKKGTTPKATATIPTESKTLVLCARCMLTVA